MASDKPRLPVVLAVCLAFLGVTAKSSAQPATAIERAPDAGIADHANAEENPSPPESAASPTAAPASAPPESAASAPVQNAAAQASEAVPPTPELAAAHEPAEADKLEHDTVLGDPFGDNDGGIRAGMISFRVLVQARYAQAFAAASHNPSPGYALREDDLVRDGDGFRLNRFFLRIGADPLPEVSARAIIDFAQFVHGGSSGAVKQAYATLRPLPKHLELHAGIFKLPFSVMELDPIARYPLANLGPSDDLAKDLGFAGRDEGIDLMVAPLSKAKRLRIYVGAYRGHSHGEHASPAGALGARVEGRPWKSLRLGADIVGMPKSVTYLRPFDTSHKDVLPMPDDPLFPRAQHFASGAAYSADVTFTRFRLMLRAEAMLGTRVDVDTRYGARGFWAIWASAAYRFRVGPLRLMPALRAEWLDADREHPVGVRRVLSLGLTVFLTKYARLLLDVTRTDVEPGSPALSQPLPLPGSPYLDLSNTMLVAQIQVET